jgi:2-dehydro-3-deoxyphosphogluconate aldolase/(4S)-4-hydroxy-2-oxoglutarate aldolase
MAKYTRIQVAQTMLEQGMVPLFYHADVELGKQALATCYRGGARLLEFTNRGDYAHEVFAELNKFAFKELPGMILGAGSVADPGTASLYIQLGANFIVGPSLRQDVALTCNRRKILYAPGCGSLTEIGKAEELGCEIVKLFPGGVYGPKFIKDIKGPQPWTLIMPTGGVSPTEENLKTWFSAGAACVGMGSQLISGDVLKNKDFDKLEKDVAAALALIKQIRSK